jgi:hypothetical protein
VSATPHHLAGSALVVAGLRAGEFAGLPAREIPTATATD